MCTVTYIPLSNTDFILTSNRDESPLRKTIAPINYEYDDVVLTYPKDEKAGGTWIGHSTKNRVVCLLNGGFKNHSKRLTYKMSRGIIVKKILSVENAVTFISDFNFKDIEPFTIVLITWEECLKAFELVWDGVDKHFNELENAPKIWSSSTLYNNTQKNTREEWFKSWLQNTKYKDENSIKAFHLNDKLGLPDFSIKMKRENVETVSVTTIVKKKSNPIKMVYKTLL